MNIRFIGTSLLVAVLIAGCGGTGKVSEGETEVYGNVPSDMENGSNGGSSAGVPWATPQTEPQVDLPEKYGVGYLYDEAVTGMGYSCNEKSGKTDEEGKVVCPLGSEATFYLGGKIFGNKKIAFDKENVGYIFVSRLFGYAPWYVPLYDDEFSSSLFVLRNSDEDGDPLNGIDVTFLGSKAFADKTGMWKDIARKLGADRDALERTMLEYAEELHKTFGKETFVATDPDISKKWNFVPYMPEYGIGSKFGFDIDDYYETKADGKVAVVVPAWSERDFTGTGCTFDGVEGDGGSHGYYGGENGNVYADTLLAACERMGDGIGSGGILDGARIKVFVANVYNEGDFSRLYSSIVSYDPDAVVVAPSSLRKNYVPYKEEYADAISPVAFPIFVGAYDDSELKDANVTNGVYADAFGILSNSVRVAPLGKNGTVTEYSHAKAEMAAPGYGIEKYPHEADAGFVAALQIAGIKLIAENSSGVEIPWCAFSSPEKGMGNEIPFSSGTSILPKYEKLKNFGTKTCDDVSFRVEPAEKPVPENVPPTPPPPPPAE